VPLQVFPVATEGQPHFTDDFGAPRVGHTHQGNDIFATMGAPVLAPDEGTLSYGVDPLGGPSFYLDAPDGTHYYGTHLSAYVGNARRVQAGEVIGKVGTGGNAKGTSPHLHFEMHPGGGAAIDPYPYLLKATKMSASQALSSTSLTKTLLLASGIALSGIGIALVVAEPRRPRKNPTNPMGVSFVTVALGSLLAASVWEGVRHVRTRLDQRALGR
jgi:Peptidase family M23